MVMRPIAFMLAALLWAGPAASDPEPPDRAALTAEARRASQSLAQDLMDRLKTALAQQGPVHAIDVCHTQAPKIAAEISQDRGLRVGRTSHRVRNPDNRPDAWEAAVLDDFIDRAADGAPVSELERSHIDATDGARVFRYMKAIPTKPLCLTCHGTDVAPAVRAAIDKRYPQDRATGFQVGDLRGAFTVSIPLNAD